MKTSGPDIAAGSSGRDLHYVCDWCQHQGPLMRDGSHWPEGWWFDDRALMPEPALACPACALRCIEQIRGRG